MSPRRSRREQYPTTPLEPAPAEPDEHDPEHDPVTVSIDHGDHRLEVQAFGAPPTEQTRCVVVTSRASRRRLCRHLREAQILADPLDRADLDQLPATSGMIVLADAAAFEPPPPPVGTQGVIAVGMLEEATAEAHIAALHAGWDAVVDRNAPTDVIVEVVWEAAQGRILLRSDVAQRLAAGATPDAAPGGDHRDREQAEPAPDAVAAPPPRPSTPEHVAHAEIETKGREFGLAGQGFGEPRTALAPVPATEAWQQIFDNSWVLWQPTTGACVLCRGGAIAIRYAELGGPLGCLGFPVGDETSVGTGTYCSFSMPGSAIVWHPEYGVHETQGVIGEYWLDVLGGPQGPWGFPVSDEYDSGGGVRAVDFEGGTLVRREDKGVGEVPRARDFAADRWLTLLPDPPRRPIGTGRAAIVGIREDAPGEAGPTLYYTPATAGLLARVHDPMVVAMCQQIEQFRSRLSDVEANPQREVGLLRTTIGPDEVLAVTRTQLPPGAAPEQLHRAEVDLWRDIWGAAPDLAASKGAKLTWAGFTADGHLEFLLATLFSRSADAQSLFLQAGIGVDGLDGRRTLVVADTEQGWRLLGDDAERYIRCDPRLLTLMRCILTGSVPSDLFGGDPAEAGARNSDLHQATLDAQFLTVIVHAGRLPGWSLLPPWTRELRAAVTHNLHLGCLSGWAVFQATDGDPVEVVRTIARDFFCGPAVLVAQSRARFEGPAGHDALREAAASFPSTVDHDDQHARYIIAGNERRRVDI